MKFGEHLQAHITPEWRKQYIQYEEMKNMLYSVLEQSPSLEIEDQQQVDRYFAQFSEEFFHLCVKEVDKINIFFCEKMAESSRRFATLKSELLACKENRKDKDSNLTKQAIELVKGTTVTRKLEDLKLAFSEFYLSLILLQKYQNLNFVGFRKILKKHDKMLQTDRGGIWRIEQVEATQFAMNKDIDKMISETEVLFTNQLESGDRQKAMKRLRVPPLHERQNPLTTFKVGLFSGAFIVLFIAVFISALSQESDVHNWRIVFRLYRGPFLVILFIFLIGVNIYGWRSSGVNHVLIFDMDPRNHLAEQDLMELAAVFAVLWALSVLSFLYSTALNIPPYVNPLILVIVMALFLFNPTKTFRHEARFWILKILGRIMCAPFVHVNFADFWIADQLNSLVPALLDFEYLICFYMTLDDWNVAVDHGQCIEKTWLLRPILAALPAWFRFAQCLRRYRDMHEANPHILNAIKYSTTFFVILFSTLHVVTAESYGHDSSSNPFFYLWLLASVVSSCYAYTWDIKMDWGLFDADSGENTLLRDEIVYSPTTYYFAVVEDLILRFGWTLSVSLTEMNYIQGDIMVTVLAPLEVFRRFVWNFLRLENEHINNVGKFRAVRDISVAPITNSDQADMLKMMDDQHGVSNRRKKKGSKKMLDKQKSGTSEDSYEDNISYTTTSSMTSVKSFMDRFKHSYSCENFFRENQEILPTMLKLVKM